MPGVEQGFDGLLAAACSHLAVMEASLMINCRIDIGMKSQAARLTAKRLLLGAIGARDEVTARTLLGGVRRPSCPSRLPALFGAPGDLAREVSQVRGVQISIHPPGSKAHGTHVQVFIRDLVA